MGFLEAFDHWLFGRINTDMANGFFDSIFPILTELLKQKAVVYFVLPALLIYFALKLRIRFFSFALALGLSLAMTDVTSHHVIKATFQRPRPANTVGLSVQLRTFPHAGYSFPSNHAANNFAAALVLSAYFYRARLLFFLFASLIAFSRIYVGVHFPLDVIGGAAWGLLMATLALYLTKPFDRFLIKRFPSLRHLPKLN